MLLKNLNDFIKTDFEETRMFLSAFCCLLDFKKEKLFYSNHGHPPQYIYRANQSCVELLPAQATLLGLPMEENAAVQNEIDFQKHDKLLLFTDGITETTNKDHDQYGQARLETFIKENHSLNPNRFNQELLNALAKFRSQEIQDDIFLLTVDIKA